MNVRKILMVLAVTVVVIYAQCPHDDATLLDWNDSSAWQDGQVGFFNLFSCLSVTNKVCLLLLF